MNPSTAEILEAVEAAPADEVVVLPNNKNIVPVAEQAAELATKPVRVVPTTSVAEGFAALLEYDPTPTPTPTPRPWPRPPAGWLRARSPGPCATPTAGAAPSPRATGWASATAIVVVAADLAERRLRPCSTGWSSDDHEMVTVIEGEGATAAATEAIAEWLAEHRPEVGGRGPPRRPAALPPTCSASSETPHAGWPQARPAGDHPCLRAARASVRRRPRPCEAWGSRPSSTCSPTTPAATSTAPARRDRRPARWARRRWCWPR